MTKFYVYEHWRLDRDECFYVGKGSGNRAYIMVARNRHHKAIVAKLNRIGSAMEVRIVASGLTEEDAFSLESERINFWEIAGVDLCNMTKGGEGASGYVFTEEQLAKVRGRKQSPEWVEKRVAGNRGRKKSPELCKKISERQIGKIISQETREKISKANKGRKRSPDFIEKQRARWPAEAVAEWRAKMDAMRIENGGWPVSESTRKKLSDAMKAKHASDKAAGIVRIVSDEEKAALIERNKSRVWTPEMRAKSSTSKMGQSTPKTEEWKAKIGAGNKGKVRSPEMRARLSALKKGVPMGPRSPDHRAKIVAAKLAKKLARLEAQITTEGV